MLYLYNQKYHRVQYMYVSPVQYRGIKNWVVSYLLFRCTIQASNVQECRRPIQPGMDDCCYSHLRPLRHTRTMGTAFHNYLEMVRLSYCSMVSRFLLLPLPVCVVDTSINLNTYLWQCLSKC